MNCGPPDQLPPPPSFLNLNWDSSMDASAAGHLDPMTSSPAASNTTAVAGATDGHALHGISPRPHYGGSPPKLNVSMMGQYHHHYPGGAGASGLPTLENLMPIAPLDQFLADPGFAERAARLSSFDARGSYGPGQFGLPDDCPVGALREMELGNARDDSSVSDPASAGAGMALKGGSDGNARKRKAGGGKGKAKDSSMSTSAKDLLAKDDSASKRCKSMEENNGAEENSGKGKAAQSSSESGGKKQGKDSRPVPDPHQDFIHVRARRGEATDSHSLAERVRREKISQRMKLLQDLVPGCNKVVGKAVMLDEIINYVQSLQRQVEFLSMKLATVNPQLDFNNLPNLLAKDMQQSCGPLQSSQHFPLDASGAPLPFMSQPHQGNNPLGCGMSDGMDDQGSMHPLDPAFCRSMGSQHHFLNGIGDAASQAGAFWQDLQSVVQMDMGQSQEMATSSNSYDGSLQTVHMKMEL
ncbi:hypothetical protein ACQ4PT_055945 [Festuca glaucescens]